MSRLEYLKYIQKGLRREMNMSQASEKFRLRISLMYCYKEIKYIQRIL